MEYKRFKTWEDAKSFSYPKENRSNYYSYIPKEDEKLPIPVHGGKEQTPWRICERVEKERGVYIEVTPLWVTITIQGEKIAKKRDIPRNGKSVSSVLYNAFK